MNDELRVLHAADLHIDSPMEGLVAYEGAPVEEVRSATRRAFSALVATAIERQVHLVVVAGDLYDGSWRDFNTGLFVVSQFARLYDVGIPVVMVYGNHDADSQLTRRLRLPPTVTALSSLRPESHVFDDLGIAVHGQSYAKRSIDHDLSSAYPNADPGLLNIGLLHTCLDGSYGHHAYAPCNRTGLAAKGYDYWALGHVHTRTVVSDDPFIVFPGNLQGRHAKETGPKGATLVTFSEGEPKIEPLVLDVVRWERCEVDLRGTRSIDESLERCAKEISSLLESGPECFAVRVVCTGETPLDARLRDEQELLTGEVQALSLALSGRAAFIEKVVIATTTTKGRPRGAGVAGEIGLVVEDLRKELADLLAADSPLPSLVSLRNQLRAASPLELEDPFDIPALEAALEDAANLLLSRIEPTADTSMPEASQ